jgi:hypothetical protein
VLEGKLTSNIISSRNTQIIWKVGIVLAPSLALVEHLFS